jgi:alanyl-tRNA synthetase
MDRQRERARAAQQFTVGTDEDTYRRLDLPASEFTGYESTAIAAARVVALVQDGQRVKQARKGEPVQVVLDRTPFYAEAGGQVGDTGSIVTPTAAIRVEDTQRPVTGLTVHYGRVTKGTVTEGDTARAEVDTERRLDVMRNHTATHLLHKALREVLGDHAQQRGSLVAPDRLRFDFAHPSGLSRDEVEAIEHRVNEQIRMDLPVQATGTTLDDARRQGATMLFGEKYGERVRMIGIDDYSLELCGGTHLNHTGQIGEFLITSEGSVGASLRRIEAITGRGADAHIRRQRRLIQGISNIVGAQDENEIEARVESLRDELKQQQREIDRLRSRIARQEVDAVLAQSFALDGVNVLSAEVEASNMNGLRERVDFVRDKLGSGVVVLGSIISGKPQLVAAVTPDLVERGLDANDLIQSLARVVGGGGGGRATLAQAGGRDADRLAEALGHVRKLVGERLDAGDQD